MSEEVVLNVDDVEVKTKTDVKPKTDVKKLQATITIKLFNGSAPDVSFVGDITGPDITIAFRSMFKSYRIWKAGQIKKEGVRK